MSVTCLALSPVLNSVSSELVPANTSRVAWLGARHEAGWGWSDGTAWHYHNWAQGQNQWQGRTAWPWMRMCLAQ